MKTNYFLSTIMVLVIFAVAAFGQRPEPRLIERFHPDNECYNDSKMFDHLAAELQMEPGAIGEIIIFGKKGDKIANMERVLLIENFIKLKRLDPSRFKIVNGGILKRSQTELWLIPVGADKIKDSGESGEWGYDLSALKKPLDFVKASPGTDSCFEHKIELYSRFLKANPKLSGKIVIYQTSSAKFRERSKYLLDQLTEMGIASARLKVIFVKRKLLKGQLAQNLPRNELWLLP